jgi:hypothetical protein
LNAYFTDSKYNLFDFHLLLGETEVYKVPEEAMHETSLGGTIRDYLSGEDIDETTYEEFRQALAKLLVEEFEYPRESLKAKVDLCFTIDGEEMCRTMDLVVYDKDNKPVMLVMFCPGDVGSYEREAGCAGWLFEGGPVPFVVISNTMEAYLIETESRKVIASGMDSIPHYNDLLERAANYKFDPVPEEKINRLQRIFYTYTGFLQGTCCSESCSLPKL